MPEIVVILALIGVALLVLVGIFLYGVFARAAVGEPSNALPVDDDETALDRALAPLLKEHPGQSGLYLVAGNVDAYARRALAARHAERSLDLLYYYWLDDLSGGLLAREVLKAADRGVRVRLLIDDINTSGRDRFYRAFDDHPKIEVRLFNPSRNRASSFLRGLELVLRVVKATRRMHNKAWLADNRIAIIGGRNVGDSYFDAGRASNFHDMDMVLAGDAVTQTSWMFDLFWNSAEVIPIGTLVRKSRMTLLKLRAKLERLAASRQAEPFMRCVDQRDTVAALLEGDQPLRWIENARVIFDPPQKAASKNEEGWIARTVLDAVTTARTSLNVISPYFIPQDNGVAIFGGLVDKGVDISILTNSLAATDVVATYGAYAAYRKSLLRRGVRLYELRSDMRRRGTSLFGSKGASLHTKAFTIDAQAGFVGSFNFDPRSVSLNTEMGILFRDEVLTAEVNEIFAAQISEETSYQLGLEGRRLVWIDRDDGHERRQDYEPKAGFWRRAFSRVIRYLPIESQL